MTAYQLDHLNFVASARGEPQHENRAAFKQDRHLPFRLAAVLLVAVVAIRLWKRRASAHERAARELLDDLAPSARTRRGRVADAKVASVPAWATLFRAAVCCAVLCVIVYTAPGGLALDAELLFVIPPALAWFSCIWKGLQTIIWWLAGERIWGRVGADTWLLFHFINQGLVFHFEIVWTEEINARYFYAVMCPAAVLGACALLCDAKNWYLSRNRPRRRSGTPSR